MDTSPSHLAYQMETITIDGNRYCLPLVLITVLIQYPPPIDLRVIERFSISDVDSTSMDELLAVDFRADSSSPSKCVHFAQEVSVTLFVNQREKGDL